MPPAVPTTEPATLAAGTTWEWTTTLDGFPPSEGWTLAYYLSGQTSLSFAATPGTADYAVSVAPTVTKGVAAGTYQWVKRATKAGATYDAGSGVFRVTRDVAADAVAGADARSHAAKMVPILEAELEARITGTGAANDSTSIGGVSISRIPTERLQAMLSAAKATAARERNGGAMPPYAVTFSAPS